MSDPISLAAAAAGFIGLAGQLAQGAIKVKEIYTTINNAPRDIADLCTKMESLRAVLEEVGGQIPQLSQGNINVDTRTLRNVITQCETSRYRVEAHVKRLSDGFRHNRGAAMKYVFKKKAIQEMSSDLEQCKSSLILARQSIDSALSSYRHETLLQNHTTLLSDNCQLLQQSSQVETKIESVSTQQRLDYDTISQQVNNASARSTDGYRSLRDAHTESSSKICESLRDLTNQFQSQRNDSSSQAMVARIGEIQRDIQTSNQHLDDIVSRRANESHVSSTLTTKRVKFGFQSILFSFSVEFSSEQGHQEGTSSAVAKEVAKRVCTIRLPNWFVQDQYSLAIARSKHGWLFHPSVYRRVDPGSPLFWACMNGDLDSIKRLLTTKQAYLGDRLSLSSHRFDVDGGISAFSMALYTKQFEACRLLVDAGILSSFQSIDYVVALSSFRLSSTSNRNEGRQILRSIEQKQNLEPDWIEDLEIDSMDYKVVRDLRLCAENAGGSALDRFQALVFPTMFRGPTYLCGDLWQLQILSELLKDEDHLREIRATVPRPAWLLFVIGRIFVDLFWFLGDKPPEHAVRDLCSALTFVCNTELDLSAHRRELSEEWSQAFREVLISNFELSTPFALIFDCWIGNMCKYWTKRSIEHLDAAMRLWVNTLHSAGVDLTAYAKTELPMIGLILRSAFSKLNVTSRLLYGPEPGDWRIETGPPGEVYPAYFWRSVEAVPIGRDLATKVLDLMHRVKHPEVVYCDAPGSWQMHWDDLRISTTAVEGYLAMMEDRRLAQMEVSLEQLDAEEFYELWDLSSMIDHWYDEDGAVESGDE